MRSVSERWNEWTPETVVIRDALEKGDYPGHPFRGNQYTDTVGAASEQRKVPAQTVRNFLNTYYPEDKTEWVLQGEWYFSEHVPLDEIDHAERPGGHDPNKVKGIAERVRNGAVMKPVVLIDTGEGKLKIGDGYHRAMGIAAAGETGMSAYVGRGMGAHGPWEKEIHEAKGNVGDIRGADWKKELPLAAAEFAEFTKVWLDAQFDKGDLPGHPFHGNQYTDGFAIPSADEIGSAGPVDYDKKLVENVEPKSDLEGGLPAALKDKVSEDLRKRMEANPRYADFKEFAEAMRVVTESASAKGDPSETSRVIRLWAVTSLDSDLAAHALQEAVRQEFGLPEETLAHADQETASRLDTLQKRYPRAMSGARAFVREMYNSTQEFLRDAGIKEMVVYRGFALRGKTVSEAESKGKLERITLQPMSSCSGSIATASRFSYPDWAPETGTSHVVAFKVPASQILATPRTGFGCYDESEVVVLGGKDIRVPASVRGAAAEHGDYEVLDNLRSAARRAKSAHKAEGDEEAAIHVDADPFNQDWLKTTWDLPPYKSPEFMEVISDLDAFRKLPVYHHAVRNGLIADDAWTGKSVEKGDLPGHPFRGNQWVDIAHLSPEQINKARQLAREGAALARVNSRAVSPLLRDIARAYKGEMVGMQHSVKTVESLQGKILRDSEAKDIPVSWAARQINDKLRYTMTFSHEDLVQRTIAITAELKLRGFHIIDDKEKNFFGEGQVYEGFHTVWTNDKGETFELQFHTPDSYRIKTINHPLYVKWRETKSEGLKAKLAERMIRNWEGHQRPQYHELLGPMQKGTDFIYYLQRSTDPDDPMYKKPVLVGRIRDGVSERWDRRTQSWLDDPDVFAGITGLSSDCYGWEKISQEDAKRLTEQFKPSSGYPVEKGVDNLVTDQADLDKGDLPGHPFHGNQYTDVQGASAEAPDYPGVPKLSFEEVMNSAYKNVATTAEKLDFPLEKISVLGGQPEDMEVNGQHFKPAGVYSTTTGNIVVYAEVVKDQSQLPGVVAHEVQHARFDSVWKAHQEEVDQIIRAHDESHLAGNDWSDPLDASGALKEDRYHFFPLIVAMGPFAVAHPTPWRPAGSEMDAWQDRSDKLAKDDGVSDYSKNYWKQYEADKSTVNFRRACDETLAEMSRIKLETNHITGSKLWRAYYRAVNSAYKSLKKSDVDALCKSEEAPESVTWFTHDWKIVPQDQADYVKLVYPDGRMLIGVVERVAKGDVPGHPFHGNQYTDATGVSAGEGWGNLTMTPREAEVFEERQRHFHRIEKQARTIAGLYGFPLERLEVVDTPGRQFISGGIPFESTADFNRTTGKITIYARSLELKSEPKNLAGVVAHEIEHAMYDDAKKAALTDDNNARDASRKATTEAENPLTGQGFGRLKPEFYDKYPALAAMQRYPCGHRLPTVDRRAYLAMRDKLAKEDGVTNYSRSFWNKFEAYKSTRDAETVDTAYEKACNETLAEIARVRHEDPPKAEKIAPLWWDFFNAVHSSHRLKKISVVPLAKEGREVSDVVYYTKDYEIVPPERADFVKVFYDDGSVVIGTVSRDVEKGDVPGHEFHGNQYTAGISSGAPDKDDYDTLVEASQRLHYMEQRGEAGAYHRELESVIGRVRTAARYFGTAMDRGIIERHAAAASAKLTEAAREASEGRPSAGLRAEAAREVNRAIDALRPRKRWKTEVDHVEKGEAPGHPFRGNQYVAAEGAAADSTDPEYHRAKEEEHRTAAWRTRNSGEAASHREAMAYHEQTANRLETEALKRSPQYGAAKELFREVLAAGGSGVDTEETYGGSNDPRPAGRRGGEMAMTSMRYWGRWENPPDARNEQDYDWQQLTQKSHDKLAAILDRVSRRYPNLEFSYQTGEKNWIYLYVEPKKAAKVEVGKGDVEGHPFRGNQYTSGTGGRINVLGGRVTLGGDVVRDEPMQSKPINVLGGRVTLGGDVVPAEEGIPDTMVAGEDYEYEPHHLLLTQAGYERKGRSAFGDEYERGRDKITIKNDSRWEHTHKDIFGRERVVGYGQGRRSLEAHVVREEKVAKTTFRYFQKGTEHRRVGVYGDELIRQHWDGGLWVDDGSAVTKCGGAYARKLALAAQLTLDKSEVAEVLKGDVPGHEFHGNQYTDTTTSAAPKQDDREEKLRVANTILQQLGGSKFRAMTGMKDPVALDRGLQFRIPGRNFAREGINRVRITLDADDTYTMTFHRARGTDIKTISSQSGLHADQLTEVFERETGLRTSLTRAEKGDA